MAKKIWRNLLRLISLLIGFVLVLLIALQLPLFQNFITQKIVSQVNEQLGIPVSVKKVKITFFNRVKIENVLLAGNTGDTIVFAQEIAANLKLTKLAKKEVHIKTLRLKEANINLLKAPQD